MAHPAETAAAYLHRAKSPIEIPEFAEITPAPGRVLVRLAKDEGGYYGKIFLPPSPFEKRYFGEVESVSNYAVEDGIDVDEPFVKAGDLVFFGKFAGTELDLNREKYIICREQDILGIIKKRDPKPEEVAADGER